MSYRMSFCAFALLLSALGIITLGAQTSPAPTVAVRRINALNHAVWPADFNGDGIADLVGTQSQANGPGWILLALGKGDGTFGTPASVGFVGKVLTVADVNSDGKPDLVVIDDRSTMAGVGVLRGRGDGTFEIFRSVDAFQYARFALVADLDGDGIKDVAVGGEGENDSTNGYVRIYAGQADGTYRRAVSLTPGRGPKGGAIGDFNGDGRQDLVVANHDSHSVTVFLNQGALNFTPSDIPIPRQANDVIVADVNRDGIADLLVAASGDGSDDLFYIEGYVFLLRGNGNGTFAAPLEYPTAPGAWKVVAADFTRDGILDLATANRSANQSVDFCGSLWDSVSILPGKSDGTFETASSFSLGDQWKPGDSRFRDSVVSLSAADVNRDGHADLIASWGAILLNQPADPNWPPLVVPSATAPDPNDHSIQLQAQASDSDQDRLTYQWFDDHGQWIEPTATPCRFVPETLGKHTFTVIVDDGHGHTDTESVIVDFGSSGGGTPPAVSVTTPAAGAVLDQGRPYTIQWTTTSSAALSGISISFSDDDGGHFQLIAECASLPGSAKSCTWNSAGPVTNFGRIAVKATDSAGQSGTGTSGRFTIRAAPGTALPYGWSHADVGALGAAGSATHNGFVRLGQALTVSGSGADIWGTADEFHYAWRTMSGDFEIETRIGSVQAVNAWTKAGLMIRANTTDPASAHASIFVTPAKGVVFQRRPSRGATSISTPGDAFVAPVWLRLVRQGVLLTAYSKKQLSDPWKLLGQQTINELPASVAVGLAVTSHADGTVATAKFEGVYWSALPVWTMTAVGGATGSVAISNGTHYTLKGSGADIWGTSDSFNYLWVPINGNATVTARVLSLGDTHVWAKAGVMVRESLAAGAKQVDGFVTPGSGMAMQIRKTTGGATTNVSQTRGVAPKFFRVNTSTSAETGHIVFVQINYSYDGTVWPILGQVQVDLKPDSYIGLAVTSHNTSIETTAVFDTVRVER